MGGFIDILVQSDTSHELIPSRMGNGPWRQSMAVDGASVILSEPADGDIPRDDIFFEYYHNDFALYVLGEIYTYRNEKLRHTRQLLLDALVLDIIEDKFDPLHCNGHFAIFIYDRRGKKWKVITSRWGTLHVYKGSSNGQRAIGTFFRSVVRASNATTIDTDALLPYFAFGFFLGADTFFKEVRILEPASVYTFAADLSLIRQEKYWNPWHEASSLGYSAVLDGLAETMDEVTRDLFASGRIAVPISGGLDSRTLAGLSVSAGRNEGLWSYSYGYTDDSIETRIATNVAQSLSLPFKPFTIDNYLFRNIDLISDSVEYFQYINGTRQANIVDELSMHADYVIAAHWGDVWFDTTVSKGGTDDRGLVGYAFNKFNKRGSAWLVENVLHRDVAAARRVLEERLSDLLDSLAPIKDLDYRLKMLKTLTWSFRWTLASIRMFQPGAFPRLPFYDTRVTDFFSTVPSRFLTGRKLQIDYLKRFHPHLARIAWQPYGTSLYHYKVWNKRMLPWRAAAKIRRLVAGLRPISRNWEVTYFDALGETMLREDLLDNDTLSAHLARDRAELLLADFYKKPTAASGYTVSMLHTFSLFLKKYC